MRLGMFIVFLGFLSSCGQSLSLTAATRILVRMYGTFEEPLGADGDSSPIAQTYLLTSIALTKEGETTPTELLEATPQSLKIIDRAQQIFVSSEVDDYVNNTYSKWQLEFNKQVVVTTKDNSETVVELNSGTLVYDTAFKMQKGKDNTLTIKVAWGKTITSDTSTDPATYTIMPPTFNLVLGKE